MTVIIKPRYSNNAGFDTILDLFSNIFVQTFQTPPPCAVVVKWDTNYIESDPISISHIDSYLLDTNRCRFCIIFHRNPVIQCWRELNFDKLNGSIQLKELQNSAINKTFRVCFCHSHSKELNYNLIDMVIVRFQSSDSHNTVFNSNLCRFHIIFCNSLTAFTARLASLPCC